MSLGVGLKRVSIRLQFAWRRFKEKIMNYIGGGAGQGGALGNPPNMIGIANAVGMVNTGQATWYGEEFQKAQKRTNVSIDQVENGYYVTINGKNYVCVEPQEIADRILAHMVTAKMEK